MGSTRALLLAGVMALGAATAAHAADLPPPPVYIPPPEPVAYGGWYLRGDVGAGLSYGPDIRSTFYDHDSGLALTPDDLTTRVPGFGRGRQSVGDVGFVDVGVGYQFNSWLRFDVTGEVRSDAKLHGDEYYDAGYFYGVPGQFYAHDIYKGSVQSSVFLVNAYADLGTWWGLTPFLGGGVGAVYNHLGNVVDTNSGVDVTLADGTLVQGVGAGGGGFATGKGSWNLAWAGMAGVSYALTQNLKLEVGYRYLDMGNVTTNKFTCLGDSTSVCERQRYHLASNDIRVGLRWLITDAGPAYIPPPMPEAPIIRKY